MVKRSAPEAIHFREGVARGRDLTERGIARETVRRSSARGDIEYASRGVYLSPAGARFRHRDLLVVAARAPQAVVCLLSALVFHRLTTELPHEVWIAVGLKARTPAIDAPPVRVVRLSPLPLEHGVEEHILVGVKVRVYSPAKTVADCFKFRNKIGIDVALAALREGFRKKAFTLDELWESAKVCRVAAVMRPYLEALTA